MHRGGVVVLLILGLGLPLAGCITTPATEAGIGQRQRWEAACLAKGLRRNTPEFYGCVSSSAAAHRQAGGTWVGVGW
jgi:hypothetical protein